MKNIILTIAVLILSIPAIATDFPLALSQNTVSGTMLTISGTSTAWSALSTAYDVEKCTHHTLVWRIVCTNESGLTLFGSLDGGAWVPITTNAVTTTTTNGISFEGKWKYLAGQFYGTNSAVVVKYLGQ